MEPDGAWDAAYAEGRAAALREVVAWLTGRVETLRRMRDMATGSALVSFTGSIDEAVRAIAAVRALLGEGASGDD